MKFLPKPILALAGILLTVGLPVDRANGAVTIVVRETGGNVEFNYSGTLDLSGLSFTTGNETAATHSILSNNFTGDAFINAFTTVSGGSFYESPFSSGPSDWFGSSLMIGADAFSGNQLVLFTSPSTLTDRLRVHTADVSGSIWSGSGSLRFDSTTLFDMGVYLSVDRVWTISNAAADTITMTAVPEPSGLLLLGLAAVGGVARRRRTS